ncbi:Ribosomal RNA small subunit methyltransferase I [Streptomyces alboniger]
MAGMRPILRPWAECASPAPGRMEGVTGTLVLAGTPIGDIADAPPRLAEELAGAEVVAAEDTRRLRRLTQALGVTPKGRVVSYFEGNESARTPELVEELVGGARVLLVTDAGMPSVSRPRLPAGRRRRGAGRAGHRRARLSAVLTALALSGLPVDRFCFEGFLPRKPGERLGRLREVAGERRTLVYFEAPHRLDDTLAAMAEVFGAERRAAVCRELTKTYEEVRRGGLGELAAWAAEACAGRSPWWWRGRRSGVPRKSGRRSWCGGSGCGRRPGSGARRRSPRWLRRPGCPSGLCSMRWLLRSIPADGCLWLVAPTRRSRTWIQPRAPKGRAPCVGKGDGALGQGTPKTAPIVDSSAAFDPAGSPLGSRGRNRPHATAEQELA